MFFSSPKVTFSPFFFHSKEILLWTKNLFGLKDTYYPELRKVIRLCCEIDFKYILTLFNGPFRAKSKSFRNITGLKRCLHTISFNLDVAKAWTELPLTFLHLLHFCWKVSPNLSFPNFCHYPFYKLCYCKATFTHIVCKCIFYIAFF